MFTWCLEGSSPFHKKMVPSLSDLHPPPPHMLTLKSLPPQTICSSKYNIYESYDKAPYKVFSYYYFPSGKPVHRAIHCPTVNFRSLSSGIITNPMLITASDTYVGVEHFVGFEPRSFQI